MKEKRRDTSSPSLSQTGTAVTEISIAADQVGGMAERVLKEMPDYIHKGAREVAVLTMAVREQAYTFAPVMEALKKLAAGEVDWSGSFIVANELAYNMHGPRFDWRKGPIKRYASFEDFYRRELEQTWGKWTELQQVYDRVARGELSEDAARAEIQRRRQQQDQQDRENVRPAGRPTNVYSTENEVHNSERPAGNSTPRALRRLRKDRPELHARVLAGELSPNAAMIEAGFRRKTPSRKQSRVERAIKLVEAMTAAERRAFWKHFGK